CPAAIDHVASRERLNWLHIKRKQPRRWHRGCRGIVCCSADQPLTQLEFISTSATSGRENSSGGRWPALSSSRTFVPARKMRSSGALLVVLSDAMPLVFLQ